MRIRLVVVCGLLMAIGSAQAQTYRCGSGRGAYWSDRPCGEDPHRTQIGVYGPTRSNTSVTSSNPLPAAPKAQEHIKYLPSGCSSIAEAVRTAPARGVPANVVRSLQDEYTQKCALEDQEARNQLGKEKAQERQVKLAEREGAAREHQQAQLRADQCANMRDVIALKRRRESQLNPMEVNALRDLEKSYNERCIAR